ncbi:6-pyruvoyl trahydropterin synthase family protein [Desulfogranum mediterraneum]|uniref:6-pyruvoyl trahydropterin synthase family protein n=1 Tax=Desulfogranum mediterraneum TaxID=160661 RepID=UPI00042063DC|nr:6-carboxytetrahydropterin synthase [Desulfogranum mediterraneum]
MLSISKEFRFDAAHRLCRPELSPEENQALYGKCASLHGHSYTLQLTVSGELDASGMIINFTELKQLGKALILDRYDHANLNELPEYAEIPVTAENMVRHIFSTLSPVLSQKGLRLVQVRLYETPDSWATMTAEPAAQPS